MPTEADKVFRDFNRYTGDGLPGEPLAAPLPQGDPASGGKNLKKSEIRDWANQFAIDAPIILADVLEGRDAAQDAAAQAALYDGPKVDTITEALALTTATAPAVGEYLRVIGTGSTLERLADGATADITTPTGQGFKLMTDWSLGGSVKSFGAGQPGSTDDTAFLQEAFDVMMNTKTVPNAAIDIPPGVYLTDGINIGGVGAVGPNDMYYKNITCSGVLRGANPSGAIFNAEGLLGNNIRGLKVENESTAVGSMAARFSRFYHNTLDGCYFKGGEYACEFDGNANLFLRSSFRFASRSGLAMLGTTGNCVVNKGVVCNYSDCGMFGFEINRTSGLPYADFINDTPYFEFNGKAHVYLKNNPGNVTIENGHFLMTGQEAGILLAGTLAAPDLNRLRIYDNGFGGPAPFTAVAIEAGSFAGAYANTRYSGNVLNSTDTTGQKLGFTEVHAGCLHQPLTLAVNDRGVRRIAAVKNGDFAALIGEAGTMPADWTDTNDPSVITSAASISEYGNGTAMVIPAGYAVQTVKVRPKTLYKIQYVTKASAATEYFNIEIWRPAFALKLLETTVRNPTAATAYTEYFFSGVDTELQILLRKKISSGSGDVRVSDFRMTDMTH